MNDEKPYLIGGCIPVENCIPEEEKKATEKPKYKDKDPPSPYPPGVWPWLPGCP